MTAMVTDVHLQLWLPRLCCENTHLGMLKVCLTAISQPILQKPDQ